MNILLESRAFYPSVGGLEMMSQELATAWQEAGHATRVVTVTSLEDNEEIEEPPVHRHPSGRAMYRHVRWADVFVQSGISLRSLHWPLLTGTPLVIIHHNMLQGGQERGVRAVLKRVATYLGANVAVSRPVANTVPGPVVSIPNTFRPAFDQLEDPKASRCGLLFVGRLVSVKGAGDAIEALRQLRDRGVTTTLTICGDGPERPALEQEVQNAGLQEAVTFKGWVDSATLAEQYRTAELLLVPSRYEPFGIVALEAIASGCPVVATRTGGLPEAVSNCGLLVPPGDPTALADAVEQALQPEVRKKLRAAMPAHTARHRIDRIATDYLHVLRHVKKPNT